MNSKRIFASVLLSSVLLSSCSNSVKPPKELLNPTVGSMCKIQFKRDALGAAVASPVPPMTDNFNGADTNVIGKLDGVSREWVVLTTNDSKKLWIPREVVLLIEVERK